LLLAAFCIDRFLSRRRAAAERHMLWAAAIISGSILPALSLLIPSWQPPLAGRVAAALPAISTAVAHPRPSPASDVAFRAQTIESTVLGWVWPVVWFAGSTIGLLVVLAAFVQRRRLTKQTSTLADPAVACILMDVARDIGCRRSIQLRTSPGD